MVIYIDEGSHRLIDQESYTNTYKRIKENWGREIAKNWTEKSDPQKSVYEDCGIVSYLIELWKKQKISFKKAVDLGCGNGLLVYLLALENVPIKGLDVRKRKVWDEFNKLAELYHVPLNPTSSNSMDILKDVDFLIGNHSDELTPWVPIIAARLKCNFFLLPCCAYDFFSKFSKTARKEYHGGLSDKYYAYIQNIIIDLGFDLKVDNLKIPSRKRKCFVGTIPVNGLPLNIEEIIEKYLSIARKIKPEFVARPALEENNNCTKLPRTFCNYITKKLFNFLFEYNQENLYGWRCGGGAKIIELSELLNSDEKQLLKNQNGGLQTFIRNQHQVFLTDRGRVFIRKWPIAYKSFLNKTCAFQRSPCWFNANHPDGCPIEAKICPYKH